VSQSAVPRFASPWEHELTEKVAASDPSGSQTVRYFDRGRQRRRLLVKSSFQWLITAVICGALAGTLYGFATIILLTSTVKHVFNALITGLSLLLGFNLASSMKGYAQMMRWRFLASKYRTLQDFDLIMDCDNNSTQFRLLWAGRTRGQWYPNKTQLLAALSLLVNVALQIFTALLGLTYSIDVSVDIVQDVYGNVSIADLSVIATSESASTFQGQAGVANQYGIMGEDYRLITTTLDDDFAVEQSLYTDEGRDLYWFRFVDRSPTQFSRGASTYRTITSNATCTSYPVVEGGYAGFNNLNATDGSQFLVTWVDSQGLDHTWSIDEVATGSTTWMSNTSVTDCGPRCSQIWALQSADNVTSDVPVPRFWQCNNTVGQVTNTDRYINPSQYQVADEQARVMAGAIGFSGITVESGTFLDTLESVRYSSDSEWSPPGNLSERDMARVVMKFTAGAFSALDENGPHLNVTGYAPEPAQIVNVQWKYAGAILAGIPCAHAAILLVVIACANTAIIKDTSSLSTARLLRPIVDKLGDSGCLLTRDDIAEQLHNLRVIYGVRMPGDAVGMGVRGPEAMDYTLINHLDILEESEGLGPPRGSMPEGRYDGLPRPPKHHDVAEEAG